MAEHNDLGNKGEEVALQFLVDKGYNILETNWTFGKEEIDIIAIDREFLIVVEVKTRYTDEYGDPAEFVNKNKQRLLVKAAQAYVERHRIQQEVRFDIISIILNSAETRIKHLPNAFYPVL